MSVRRIGLLTVLLYTTTVCVRAQGLDTAKIDQSLGRSGEKTGDVYRVGFPRTDLHVEVGSVPIKPGLALGSWAAFSGSDSSASVMGDLVLLESEVSPVMRKLRAAGIEITAVHNHLLNETPRVLYMHYLGHGSAVELANSLRAALALSKTPLGPPATSAAPDSAPAFVKTVEGILGRQGKWNGGVLAFGISRSEPITENGMMLTAPQGVAESINFQETAPGQIATTGDFVLKAGEVNPVVSALEAHGIEVTALHSHMLSEEPRLFFMHFWANGNPETVAQGIQAALGNIATK